MTKLFRFGAWGFLVGAFVLGGCASMTPATQVKQGYTLYDVKADASLNAALSKAIVDAMKANIDNVRVVSNFPPSPLPIQPGRFKMVSPFGPQLSALAQSSGGAVSIPTCDNATANVTAFASGMSNHGENTMMFACLIPY